MAQENLNSPEEPAKTPLNETDTREAQDEGAAFVKPILKGAVEATVVSVEFKRNNPPKVEPKKNKGKDGVVRFQEKVYLQIGLKFPKGTIATNTTTDLSELDLWTSFGCYADNVDQAGNLLPGKKLSRWAGEKSGCSDLLQKCRDFASNEELGVSKIPEVLNGRTVRVKTEMVNVPGGKDQTPKFVIASIVK